MNKLNAITGKIPNTIDKKPITSLCKKISKKFSYKSSNDLENLANLVTWLYIYNYYDEALEICDLINEIKFNGNYTLWDNIDTLYCIKARILREQGSLTNSNEIVCFVNQYRNPHLYKNIVDWFENTLDFNIKNAIEQFNSKSLATNWRLVKLQCAIKYREAGNFPISNTALEKIISEQITILSQNK